VAFGNQKEIWQPLFFALAVATMTVGNLIALRQTNVIRILAYSSVAQAGFMLVPLAVAGDIPAANGGVATGVHAVVTYMLIYTAMNLGAFATVMAVFRKTRSAELSSFGGLFEYAPGLTLLLTVFVFALAGIPPLGGWYAKFVVIKTLFDAFTPAAVVLGVFVAINSVIALYYYASLAREMWMRPVPDGDRTRVSVPASLAAAVALCAIGTVVIGVLPNIIARFGDLASFVG
jgi:NADH-quinone oxidoreductase subunit N